MNVWNLTVPPFALLTPRWKILLRLASWLTQKKNIDLTSSFSPSDLPCAGEKLAGRYYARRGEFFCPWSFLTRKRRHFFLQSPLGCSGKCAGFLLRALPWLMVNPIPHEPQCLSRRYILMVADTGMHGNWQHAHILNGTPQLTPACQECWTRKDRMLLGSSSLSSVFLADLHVDIWFKDL